MKKIYAYLRKHKSLLLFTLFLATINQSFSLINPQIARLLTDNYALKVSELTRAEFIKGTGILLAIGIAAALISRVAKTFQDYYTNVITQKIGTEMYADGISHAFSLPYQTFEDQRSGEILQKLQKARTDVQIFIMSSIGVAFLSLVGILIVVAYAFFVNWIAGVIFLALIPFLAITSYFSSKRIKEAQSHVVRELTDLAGSTTETLRNVELVKSLGLEHQETKRLNDVNTSILHLELFKVKLIRTVNFTQGTLVNFMRSLLQFVLLYLIFTGGVSVGEFFSLLFYSFFVFNPLYELGSIAAQYHEAQASMEIMDEIMNIPAEPLPKKPVVIQKISPIVFDNVSFGYRGLEKSALRDASFTINPGETVAFVGPSGSGKTTLLKLLIGLYKPTKGTITVADTGHQHIDYKNMRKKIGYVSQETQLFAGTLRDNLLFVRPEASDEECIEALTAASAKHILERSEKGLDTKIGEGGIKISGGERQRLAIARALLRKPELIIFDEATSSLDSVTETAITETIQHVAKTKNDIIHVLVAHRLSTILHADHIYVLEKGSLVESGTHTSLLEQGGLYAALWRSQSAGD